MALSDFLFPLLIFGVIAISATILLNFEYRIRTIFRGILILSIGLFGFFIILCLYFHLPDIIPHNLNLLNSQTAVNSLLNNNTSTITSIGNIPTEDSSKIRDFITILAPLLAGVGAFLYLFGYISNKATLYPDNELDKESNVYHIFLNSIWIIMLFPLIESFMSLGVIEYVYLYVVLAIWFYIMAFLAKFRLLVSKNYEKLSDVSRLLNNPNKERFKGSSFFPLIYPFSLLFSVILLWLGYLGEFNFLSIIFGISVLLQIHWVVSLIQNTPQQKFNVILKEADLFARLKLTNVFILSNSSNNWLKILQPDNQIVKIEINSIQYIEHVNEFSEIVIRQPFVKQKENWGRQILNRLNLIWK
jgi:hypothetical protein